LALVTLPELTAPVGDGDPCGPDLDLAGDPEYMNFLARAEGLVPASFFDAENKPFDRGSIDFEAEVAAIKRFLAKTRDLRLLVLLAKLLILNRDLEGFATCVLAIASLLGERWEAVHPRGADGDYGLRMAALATLDDVPPVIMPLQYLPIAEHRRFGPICFRHQLIASGQANPREGEDAPDANTIEQALTATELTLLVARRDWCRSIKTALVEVRQITTAQAGYEQAVSLERLSELLDRMLIFLDSAVAKRDPSAAVPAAALGGSESQGEVYNGGSAAAARTGLIRSNADAAAALAAVVDYFTRREPSSPALLLVRQAEQLMGKPFLEVMRVLVPEHFDQAKVCIGGDHAFELPVGRLAEFAPALESSNRGRAGSADFSCQNAP
jgi:type VI secretion system protein ImpA